MWICLYDCFFSIVKKDCADDELMVRARRPGDIEKIFKNVVVTEYTNSDYHYRAAVKRDDIIAAIATEITDIDYPNFKDQVSDVKLHNAYMRIWTEMSMLQPKAPYSGRTRTPQKKGKKKP